MNTWIDGLSSNFPLVVAQDSVLPFQAFKNAGASPEILLPVLGVMTSIILIVVIGVYRFKRWKKYKTFESEMKTLDLDPESEGTFAYMVKRYSMEEPVNILYSPRIFDEMASLEITRVLASNASLQSKCRFIDLVYSIRTKTYHPDWITSQEAVKTSEAESLVVSG
ncbi:MAG: hypothetical protein AB1656_23270 [Candidatus Omnitrophota bacterium]